MTDRVSFLVVALEQDIRDDDCQPLIEAIKQLRGVIGVEPKMAGYETWAAELRARNEFKKKLWDALQ